MATESGPKPERVWRKTKRHTVTPVPPTDATLVRQRWIPRPRREWAYRSADIMREYGIVEGGAVYKTRNSARKHAQTLMKLIVELRIFDKQQLIEHTEKRGDGWAWMIEYDPTGENKRRPTSGRSDTVAS